MEERNRNHQASVFWQEVELMVGKKIKNIVFDMGKVLLDYVLLEWPDISWLTLRRQSCS